MSSAQLDLDSPRRRLAISAECDGTVWVGLYSARKHEVLTTAVAIREPEGRPYRRHDQFSVRDGFDDVVNLWVGSACFRISGAEADKIVATYRDHGIQDHRSPTSNGDARPPNVTATAAPAGESRLPLASDSGLAAHETAIEQDEAAFEGEHRERGEPNVYGERP